MFEHLHKRENSKILKSFLFLSSHSFSHKYETTVKSQFGNKIYFSNFKSTLVKITKHNGPLSNWVWSLERKEILLTKMLCNFHKLWGVTHLINSWGVAGVCICQGLSQESCRVSVLFLLILDDSVGGQCSLRRDKGFSELFIWNCKMEKFNLLAK